MIYLLLHVHTHPYVRADTRWIYKLFDISRTIFRDPGWKQSSASAANDLIIALRGDAHSPVVWGTWSCADCGLNVGDELWTSIETKARLRSSLGLVFSIIFSCEVCPFTGPTNAIAGMIWVHGTCSSKTSKLIELKPTSIRQLDILKLLWRLPFPISWKWHSRQKLCGTWTCRMEILWWWCLQKYEPQAASGAEKYVGLSTCVHLSVFIEYKNLTMVTKTLIVISTTAGCFPYLGYHVVVTAVHECP